MSNEERLQMNALDDAADLLIKMFTIICVN